MAKSKLESEGIPAFLHSVNHSTMSWPITLAIGGIRLQVAPSTAVRAREILGVECEVEPASEPIVCPSCGSGDARRYKAGWKVAFLATHLFGIPLPFSSYRQRCRSCDYIWKLKS